MMVDPTHQTLVNRRNGLADLAPAYGAIFCDVWGVLHNGLEIYLEAAAALSQYRAQGGRVIMITNSPRPKAGVVEQLVQLGAPDTVYDDIVTSGDVTRDLIRQADGAVYHIGPDRDLPLFAGLDVKLTAPDAAKAIVCTGLFEDETEVPEDYRSSFEPLVARGLPFICANPDIVVERGDRLIWCAGALARLYEEMGGETRLAGKPHTPIYDLAMERLEAISGETPIKANILAIGDGMPTDVAGALNNGFPLLYISSGIHAVEYGDPDTPDPVRLQEFLEEHEAAPTATMPRLVWKRLDRDQLSP